MTCGLATNGKEKTKKVKQTYVFIKNGISRCKKY